MFGPTKIERERIMTTEESKIKIEFLNDGSIADGVAIINDGEGRLGHFYTHQFAYCPTKKIVYTGQHIGGWRIHVSDEEDAKRRIAREIADLERAWKK